MKLTEKLKEGITLSVEIINQLNAQIALFSKYADWLVTFPGIVNTAKAVHKTDQFLTIIVAVLENAINKFNDLREV